MNINTKGLNFVLGLIVVLGSFFVVFGAELKNLKIDKEAQQNNSLVVETPTATNTTTTKTQTTTSTATTPKTSSSASSGSTSSSSSGSTSTTNTATSGGYTMT